MPDRISNLGTLKEQCQEVRRFWNEQSGECDVAGLAVFLANQVKKWESAHLIYLGEGVDGVADIGVYPDLILEG